jgi:type III pantothenate kinase
LNIVIDIGNTIVKVATFQDKNLIAKDVLEYSELIQFLKAIKFKKGIISNVGNENLENQVLAIYPFIISMSNDLSMPLKSHYSSMDTIGKDRLANAVAAFTENPNKSSLVIDAGSCLTFDFIDSNNCYQGGSISPGLSMRFNSLHKFTEKLPLLNEKSSDLKLIGSDTKSSIVSGVVNGFASEITTSIINYRSKYPLLTIFMTGGDCRFVKSIVEVEKNGIFAIENLTMIGLNTILKYNDK